MRSRRIVGAIGALLRVPSRKAPAMSDLRSRRIIGHLRRNLVAYVALVGMVAFSPVPSVATDLVTTEEIANGSITAQKLAPDSVTRAKIADGAVTTNAIADSTVGVDDIADLEWRTLNLTNGWTNAGLGSRPPAWAVDGEGVVHLRGVIHQVDPGDPNFGKLPLAARPVDQVAVPTVTAAGNLGVISIASSGALFVYSHEVPSSAQTYTSLDGIAWTR